MKEESEKKGMTRKLTRRKWGGMYKSTCSGYVTGSVNWVPLGRTVRI